jgi:FAD/FMN-containing dehydrogenase
VTLTTPVNLDIEALRGRIGGSVITPADPEYDAARTIVLGGTDPRPAIVVRVADAEDVATAIAAARDSGAELAVRSGGHSGAGHGTVDGGIVIDVRDLRSLEIDAASRSAWAGSGLTAGDFTTEAARHGFAVGFGDTGSVGLGGLVTGGGVGYLVRKLGLTIDSLLAAEIVTADGEVRIVDAEHEPELFWAIRGGGGNFGVVTRFKFRLHELPEAYGGMLILPATADTVAGFMAAQEAASEELSSIANVMNCPPMPFVPEEVHGTVVIFAMVLYAGSAEDGKRAVAPFRALAAPHADMLAPIGYPDMFQAEEADADYHPTAVSVNLFLDRVDRSVAAAIMERLETSDATLRVAQLRVLGGAYARVPADATAYAHRDKPIMVNLAAFYEGEEDKPRRQAWLDEFRTAIAQGDDAAYSNFLTVEPDRIRAAYPGSTYDRLAAIKRRYDPDNLFHRNQNIVPA